MFGFILHDMSISCAALRTTGHRALNAEQVIDRVERHNQRRPQGEKELSCLVAHFVSAPSARWKIAPTWACHFLAMTLFQLRAFVPG